MSSVYDLAVIGGGASGMMACIAAGTALEKAPKHATLCLLEQAPKLGKKLLATGNGRCNLSNTAMATDCYFGDTAVLSSLLKQYTPKKLQQLFTAMGLLCRADKEGRVYPYNLQASAVVETMQQKLNSLPVTVETNAEMVSIQKAGKTFLLTAKDGKQLQAKAVILSAGGKAAPKLGGIGGGTALAKQLRHTIAQEMPALVPLLSSHPCCKTVKGVRSFATVTLAVDDRAVQTEQGEVQFTEAGLSGICIFQLSHLCGQALANKQTVTVVVNIMPEYQSSTLAKQIAGQCKRYPDLEATAVLHGMLPKKLGEAVITTALQGKLPASAKALTFAQCEAIAYTIQHFAFPITRLGSYDAAQVTAGGVLCSQVDFTTMESRIQKQFYLTGELLNIDGLCGGYNLHFAFATGHLAGISAAKAIIERG